MMPTRYKLLKIVARISLWRQEHISENAFVLILCGLTGVVIGFFAFMLKFLLKETRLLLIGDLSPLHPHWRLLFLPLVGIILTVIYTKFILKKDIEQSVTKIKYAITNKKYYLSPRLTYAPIIGSTLTLGFGNSAGAEGPIAYVGAAIGSNIGRIFRLNQQTVRNLLAIGAGAGIAAIFKAPVGGILFTIEILHVEMSVFSIIALVLSCVIASATCLACTGYTPDLFFHQTLPFNPSLYPWTLLLGVLCGLYSVYYSYQQTASARFFMNRKSIITKILISGLTMSLTVTLLPALYGEGYNAITDLINDRLDHIMDGSVMLLLGQRKWVIPVAILIMLAIKGYLVAAANTGGGVAGDFTPTLFAGALAGYLFALLVNTWLPVNLPSAHFALVGMAAVMAGILHAPLMAIFIVVEMSSSYGFFFPIVVAALVSYTIVKLVTPDSKYQTGKHDDIHFFTNDKLAKS